ncbi:uncharacterized protein [Triticum aestivum]|uniref:uncharacterized protein n=1 Tax=Triticum aestivum TaxID=4565 RepID=UPI001D030936|nr:uncharacterized protein LOC123153146 [Triticum aestivum]
MTAGWAGVAGAITPPFGDVENRIPAIPPPPHASRRSFPRPSHDLRYAVLPALRRPASPVPSYLCSAASRRHASVAPPLAVLTALRRPAPSRASLAALRCPAPSCPSIGAPRSSVLLVHRRPALVRPSGCFNLYRGSVRLRLHREPLLVPLSRGRRVAESLEATPWELIFKRSSTNVLTASTQDSCYQRLNFQQRRSNPLPCLSRHPPLVGESTISLVCLFMVVSTFAMCTTIELVL